MSWVLSQRPVHPLGGGQVEGLKPLHSTTRKGMKNENENVWRMRLQIRQRIRRKRNKMRGVCVNFLSLREFWRMDKKRLLLWGMYEANRRIPGRNGSISRRFRESRGEWGNHKTRRWQPIHRQRGRLWIPNPLYGRLCLLHLRALVRMWIKAKTQSIKNERNLDKNASGV